MNNAIMSIFPSLQKRKEMEMKEIHTIREVLIPHLDFD